MIKLSNVSNIHKSDVNSSCCQKSLKAPVDAYRCRLSMPAQPASVLVLSKLLTSSGDATYADNNQLRDTIINLLLYNFMCKCSVSCCSLTDTQNVRPCHVFAGVLPSPVYLARHSQCYRATLLGVSTFGTYGAGKLRSAMPPSRSRQTRDAAARRLHHSSALPAAVLGCPPAAS